MANLVQTVDAYLQDGCGRCSHYKLPSCKVHTWQQELQGLRNIVLQSELTEEIKWGQPCYTLNGGNVLIVSSFKESCVINFMKGVLLSDPQKLLSSPGENSQSARWIKFTSLAEITQNAEYIAQYIQEAIAIEKSGAKPIISKEISYPAELLQMFESREDVKTAFLALTPGRQRAYCMHFAQAKQEKTRFARIEKYIPTILAGKGMLD